MCLCVKGIIELKRRLYRVGIWLKDISAHREERPDRTLGTFLVFKNLTVSSVFCMSGILSFKPAALRCWLASINWYFLQIVSEPVPFEGQSHNVRYHFLKALEGGFYIGSGCYIVLDSINEWRIRDTPRICRRSGFSGKARWLAKVNMENRAVEQFTAVTYFDAESGICIYTTSNWVVLL